MPELTMTEERLKAAIHFRTIDEPCCGNCEWFRREWEDTNCEHPQNIWHFPDPHPEDNDYNYKLSFNHEHDVCDRFERREENHDN